MEYYNTIEQESEQEFSDRGSRFIAYAFPISSALVFKEKMAVIKKNHPKAVHHCFAYRIGTDGNTFRSGDDGEPSGSAGKPILGQLDSYKLTNVAVVVVRYFGGTLLGVPGLINAYKTATALALQTVPIVTKAVEVDYMIHCAYNLLNDAMVILKQNNCSIQKVDQSLFCTIHTGIALSRLSLVLNKLSLVYGLTINKVADEG